MKAKRKRHNGAFKAKVGLDAILGIKTVAQIAREYQVHPGQVSQWKTVIRERLPELFETEGGGSEDSEAMIALLHEKIGELTVDLDWLKKKSKKLGL
jgi:transposase-like protein